MLFDTTFGTLAYVNLHLLLRSRRSAGCQPANNEYLFSRSAYSYVVQAASLQPHTANT
jgi:hypothetical protein